MNVEIKKGSMKSYLKNGLPYSDKVLQKTWRRIKTASLE